jgi:tetratricopeptide (TPR) repeat protein
LQGRDIADKLLITESIEHFDKAITLDPNFATAHLNRANAGPTAKEFFAHLKTAVALASKTSEGERLLILAAEAGANGNAAKQREHLEKLVALYPKDERAQFALGTFYFGQQEYAKAIASYNATVSLAPEFSPTYNLLGYAQRQIENFDEAEKAFKKYTELIPNDPNPHDSYAELLMKIGKFDESIVHYQKALSIDPTFAASKVGIAMNNLYKGKPDEATVELNKLYANARNDGERRQGLFVQAVVYTDIGKLELAAQEAEKEFAIAERIGDVASMTADLIFKGNILEGIGKYDDAIAAYERALKLTDESNLSEGTKNATRLFHHYNTATAAIGKNDLKKARSEAEEFRKGAEANKNQNQIHLAHELAGTIALTEKNNDTAINELLKSNLQDPRNLYRLALAYKAKGNDDTAKEYATKAARFNGLPNLNYALVRSKAEKMIAAM